MGFSWFILIVSCVTFFPALEARLDDCFNVGGLLVPVFTPVDDNGDINFDVIGQYAQYLHGHGINGVVVAATSGEGPSMNMSDNKKLLDSWMEAAKALDMWVISSVGATPMPFTQEMTRYSEQIGVDAILAMPDVFFDPTTPEELIFYLDLLSKEAPNTPLFYDDIPEYTRVDQVDMEEFFYQAKTISTFRGIKSNNFTALLELRDDVEEPYLLFASEHVFLAPEAFMGFENYMMADANLFPDLFTSIIENGLNGYLEEAREQYQTLVDVLEAITDDVGISHEIVGLKEAMTLLSGIDMGPPLPPLQPATDEQKAAIEQALNDYNFTTFNPDDY